MNTSTIVSVIVPMYNVEKYIEQCIKSVLAQTYPHFEIICVDDGCTDKTVDILSTFNDVRIRFIQQKNKGLAAARNTGINAAQGIYIALLDSDDFWAPTKLEKHVRHLQHNPQLGLSYCPSIFVDENGHPMGIGQYPKLTNIKPQDILCRNPVGNGSAAVIRRRALNDIGVVDLEKKRFYLNYFDPNFRQSEDIECWLRLALNTDWQFGGIKEALTFYRVNTNGLSANIDKQHANWQEAMRKNRIGHEQFFNEWYSLAEAYQERYLARRAVQSGDGTKAMRMIHRALLRDCRILFQEPIRTLVTYACCCLSLLPNNLYRHIQTVGMDLLGRYRIS